MQPPNLLETFIGPLERGGISYFVTGSMAAIFYGEPRLTHDVDVVVHLRPEDVPAFVALFPESRFYCPPPEVIRVELERQVFAHFNLIHSESGLKADIYPDGADGLHAWAFRKRRRVDLGGGHALWVAPPEYVIVRKLEYFREGGSQKHVDDIRKMLRQPELALDLGFLDAELARRGLTDFWEKAKA